MDKPPDPDAPPSLDQMWADYGSAFSTGPPPRSRRERTLRLLSWCFVISAAGGAGIAVWALVPATIPPLALGGTAVLAGLAAGWGAFALLTRWRSGDRAKRPGEADPPMYVLYGPPPEPPDPKALPFEERLLFLCKGDELLRDRLIECERQRHPFSRRGELVRLAIQHFRRDLK